MRFVKSESYFPVIIGIHLILWAVDLSLYGGSIALVEGEDELQRVLGEIMSSWVVTVFGFNLLMTTRLPWVERLFGGLDKMYLIHRRSGVIAAVLLLLHFGIVPRHPEFSIGKPMGFAALALIILGIVFAASPLMKRKIPYHKWLSGHRLMGPAYVVGVSHALFVPTLTSQLPLVRIYVFGMAMLGVLSWVYRVFLFKRFQRPKHYVVKSVHRFDRAIIEVRLAPVGEPLPYIAGQFAFFSFERLGPSQSHPFTIASSPQDDELRIAVKASGDFTSELVEHLKEGDKVSVEGAYGHLTQAHVKSSKQIWIGGGIGITPFLSMAANANESGVRASLFWSVRNESEAHFDRELEERAESTENLGYHLWKSDKEGYLSLDALGGAEAVSDKDIFICGPAALRDSLIDQLRSAGVPARRIHTEEFAFR